MTKKAMVAGALACCLLLVRARAGAQNGAWMAPIGDHLACAQFKEMNASRASSTLNLGAASFIAHGCVVKRPPVLACESATTANINPTPPGGGPNGLTTGFFCYKAKCPRSTEYVAGTDQFGHHGGQRYNVKLLCAPASPSGAFLD
jgi:hypothetical protein